MSVCVSLFSSPKNQTTVLSTPVTTRHDHADSRSPQFSQHTRGTLTKTSRQPRRCTLRGASARRACPRKDPFFALLLLLPRDFGDRSRRHAPPLLDVRHAANFCDVGVFPRTPSCGPDETVAPTASGVSPVFVNDQALESHRAASVDAVRRNSDLRPETESETIGVSGKDNFCPIL